LDPQLWEPHYNMGEIYDAANEKDKAKKEYEESIRLNHKSFKPHNGLGLLLLKENRVDEAIHQLETAVRLGPSSPIRIYNLALAFSKASKKKQARDLLNRVIANRQAGAIKDQAKRLLKTLSN